MKKIIKYTKIYKKLNDFDKAMKRLKLILRALTLKYLNEHLMTSQYLMNLKNLLLKTKNFVKFMIIRWT